MYNGSTKQVTPFVIIEVFLDWMMKNTRFDTKVDLALSKICALRTLDPEADDDLGTRTTSPQRQAPDA
jgi:hypothetical protein